MGSCQELPAQRLYEKERPFLWQFQQAAGWDKMFPTSLLAKHAQTPELWECLPGTFLNWPRGSSFPRIVNARDRLPDNLGVLNISLHIHSEPRDAQLWLVQAICFYPVGFLQWDQKEDDYRLSEPDEGKKVFPEGIRPQQVGATCSRAFSYSPGNLASKCVHTGRIAVHISEIWQHRRQNFRRNCSRRIIIKNKLPASSNFLPQLYQVPTCAA